MNILLALITAFVTTQISYEDAMYDMVMEQAINHCRNADPELVDRYLIRDLIMIEKSHEVPNALKGMILASACYESGYNPKAKGDRKFSKNKKTPKAIGLFQMWPWWENEKYGYGIERTDARASADAYIRHIKKQIPAVKKNCKFKTDKRIWIAAWVHAIRKPKDGGRCHERPKHLRILRKWHKNIKNSYKYPGFTWEQ